jgi:Rieske Fe-S protein
MEQYFRKGIIIALTTLFMMAANQGCKDDYESIIPDVPVNFNLNKGNIIELNIDGGSYYVPNEGYGGIIVFKDMTDNQNPYLAFDATCTYEISPTYRVVATQGNVIAKCPKCGSEFILMGGTGSPVKGPAVMPLKQYHTSFSGNNIIIYN